MGKQAKLIAAHLKTLRQQKPELKPPSVTPLKFPAKVVGAAPTQVPPDSAPQSIH